MKIENKSIQRKNRNYLMNPQMYENIVPKIVKVFEMLRDHIDYIEEENSAREHKMNKSDTHILVHEMVLSYPSSLEEQAKRC